MYIIVESIDNCFKDLKFDYNVVKKDFASLPINVKKTLNIIIPQDKDGNISEQYVMAPVVNNREFSCETEFDVVAGFVSLEDAVAYCKCMNAKLVKNFGYTISVSVVNDENNSLTKTCNHFVRFSSYEDVTEVYLMEVGRKLLNVKESIVKIYEEGEDDGEQSGREEGKEDMEETCKSTGCCGCGSAGAD